MSEIETPLPVEQPRLVLPFELALIRWSVVHREWHESANDMPLLTAFLAGWGCRSIGLKPDTKGCQFASAFRRGWTEADDMIEIESRRQNAATHAPGANEQPLK